jgi:hypothetical protein
MRRLMGVWGSVTASVNERLPTQQLYGAIYNAQVDAGATPGGFTMQDLNRVRSLANGWRTAPESLSRQPDTSPLGAEQIALAPWSRDQFSRNANPLYEVRYEFQTNPALPAGTQWVTIPAEAAGMPATIGDLRSMVEQHASELAAAGSCPPQDGGEEFVGIGQILVIAV